MYLRSYSSDSSSYETTYSEDIRIEKYLKEKKDAEEFARQERELERRTIFNNFVEEEDELFALPGLQFVRFDSSKVQFRFTPSEVAHVSKRVQFYCSLKHRKGHWVVKRDTFPGNYKWLFYRLFIGQTKFKVGDKNLKYALLRCYDILVKWAAEEEAFRKDRRRRYEGKELDLLELQDDDVELFLTPEETEEKFTRTQAILRRMIPPKKKEEE